MATRKSGTSGKSTARPVGGPAHLYTLEVFLISGPIQDSFLEKNEVISRTLQISGDQTLQVLHRALFKAFDRDDEHMYEFQVGGKGPMDPKARRYVLPLAMDNDPGPGKPAGDVERTTVGALGLKLDDAFGYWFDFGDDWWHQINVVGLDEKPGDGPYPRVIQRVGDSPPQYADWDEEDEDEDGEGR